MVSIEGDRFMYPVHIKAPKFPGPPREEIENLREEVEKTDPGFTELIDALDIVLDNPNQHREIVKIFRERGQYLYGLTNPTRGIPKSFIGLFLGEGYDFDDNEPPSFSIVKMGAWVRASHVTQPDGDKVKEEIVSKALYDPTIDRGVVVGMPVRRSTLIVPFHPDKERTEETTYGYMRDLKYIRDSDMPKDEIKVLTRAMAAWHLGKVSVFGQPEQEESLGIDHFRDLYGIDRGDMRFEGLLSAIRRKEVPGLRIVGETDSQYPSVIGDINQANEWMLANYLKSGYKPGHIEEKPAI